MFLKFIFLFISAAGGETDGWFPVEKAPKAEEVMTDIDSSIWVYFLKTLGSDQLSIRFPTDPVYRTLEDGFIARATGAGEIFELTVVKGKGEQEERVYEFEEKWVHEHSVRHGEYLYIMRTYSLMAESPKHAEFVSSFSIAPL